jgi:hypothetical protein
MIRFAYRISSGALARMNRAWTVVILALSVFGLAALPATAQTNSPEPFLLIISVTAESTTLGSDADEVYFLFSNGERHPAGTKVIQSGETWEPHYFTSAAEELSVSLMERDMLGADDVIGTFKITPDNAYGRFTERMVGDFASYIVIFEVRR